MAISASGVMDKVSAYAKTTEGQKRMRDKIQSYINGSDPHVKSTGKTYGGGVIMTEKEMMAAAKDLIAMLRASAASAGLPASVMEHVESFAFTKPFVAPDGSASIQIYMTDNPYRESLMPQKYGGVDNIVAIFNNGYTASDRVYGKSHDKKIVSLDKRQGSFFMQKAVDEFMAKYSASYDVSVDLNPQYSGAWG